MFPDVPMWFKYLYLIHYNMKPGITKKYLNDLTYDVVGAAIEVHKELGPGLLESVYHRCLCHELYRRNIRFQSEMNIPVKYKVQGFRVRGATALRFLYR